MKCAKCGIETERHGRNQKYCPSCAKITAAEKQKQWHQSHGITLSATERHCKKCGAAVEAHRHYCDKCLKEKNALINANISVG